MNICEGCKKSAQCSEVDRYNYPGIRFKTSFLGETLVNCLGKEAWVGDLKTLIGGASYFDPYNYELLRALRKGWITCEAEITEKGQEELGRRIRERQECISFPANGGKLIPLEDKKRKSRA